MKISNRAAQIPASPIRKLIPFADQAKAKGTKVYHLNIGQPDIVTPESMWNSIKQVESKVLAYGPSNGLLEFRMGLTHYYAKYKVDVTTDDIIITTGGSEALLFAMLTTCDPGDEIIVPEPYYANYNGFANLAQVEITPLTTYATEGFHLPPKADIVKLITPKTKALLFSNPSNPTGVVYTLAELTLLLEIAEEYDLYIIADEVYREFIYEGELHSMLSLPNTADRVIVADSISKRYSACGARIGALVCKNPDLIAAVMKYAQARLCPPTLEQIGAIGALSVPDTYYSDIVDEYRKRRDTVLSSIAQIDGAICKVPQGAFYCIVNLPIDDCEKFAKWMLTDFQFEGATTMVAPATGFYGTDGSGLDEVRIAYVLKSENLAIAMRVLRAGILEYRKTCMNV